MKIFKALVLFAASVAFVAPSIAFEDGVFEIDSAAGGAERGPIDHLEALVPSTKYPIEPVPRRSINGAPHEFVSTSTGAIAFRDKDLLLPGRSEIEAERTYDSLYPFPKQSPSID